MPLLATALISLLLSLLAGTMANTWLANAIPVLGSFFQLKLSHNPGIAFSMSLPSPWQELLIVVALIGVIIIAVRSERRVPSDIGFGLILGGAFANLIDRALHGAVTDFIAVGSFPIFNLADSCITVGAAILIVEEIVRRKK